MSENPQIPDPDSSAVDQTPETPSPAPEAQTVASTPEAPPVVSTQEAPQTAVPEPQPVASMPDAQPAVSTPEVPPVVLTPDAQHYLSQTGPWVRFLSIMMFIGAAFMILSGAGMVLIGLAGLDSSMGSMGSGSLPNGAVILLGPVYIVMAVLFYLLPGIFLFRYASAIKLLKSTPSSPALEDALRNQKSFWRYLGILAIIMLCIFVLAVMAIIFFAAIMSLRR
jgi:hypothetical protein